MTDLDPFQNAKGLIGGHPEQRKGDVGVEPLIHRYVLRPFHEPADVEHGKEFCANQTVEVEIGFARGFILLRAMGTTFTVRQIEDKYPDYERVIPPSSPLLIIICIYNNP